MKIIKIIVSILFSLILIIPLCTFNFTENAISEIDNRNLTPNPFSANANQEGDLTENVEDYVNDRIGFRDEMILAYTVLNDKLFNKMEHPSYKYGQDGYVFGSGLTTAKAKYTSFHEAFAYMVKHIQDYCEARNIPFLFVFNPAKPAVLSEFIPLGLNYSRQWVIDFLAKLDKLNVRYLDNTTVLREKYKQGENVFNQKYDANHWNYVGAYHGTNAILTELKNDLPSIHVNTQNDITITSAIRKTLMVSQFPINESVPIINMNNTATNITETYKKELELHNSYRSFGYYKNQLRTEENAPKALVFQGSYMNNYGYKFLTNAFSEYIHVHDYQNVIDFPYYINIFQPDCVVFEVAEYTFANTYFNQKKMESLSTNPVLSSLLINHQPQERLLPKNSFTIQKGQALTKIQWNHTENVEYAWLMLDKEYDFKTFENGHEITIPTPLYEQYKDSLQIYIKNDKGLILFK